MRRKKVDVKRETARRELLRMLETATERQLDVILAFLETLQDHPEY